MTEELTEELKRCKELLKIYKDVGMTGVFGATILNSKIKRAEEAIECGDEEEMLECLDALKECN